MTKRIGLNIKDLTSLTKQMHNINNGIRKASISGLKKAGRMGVEKLKEYTYDFSEYDFGQGRVAESSYYTIVGTKEKPILKIGQHSRRARYFEYGTGEVGEAHPHPLASMVGWNYAVGYYSSQGAWAFPNTDGYKPVGEIKVPKYIYTKGQRSHKQMYLTRIWMITNIKNLLGEQLNLALAKRIVAPEGFGEGND